MRILLDTHILLWWLMGDELLPKVARELIRDPGNLVFVSAVSLWEIWLKVSLKKLEIPEGFEEQLAQEGFESLPLTGSHTREVARLEWLHRDPFDRMLVAQAKAERLILLTVDEVVAGYGEFVRLVR